VAFHGDTRSRRLVLKTAERSARRLLARARRVRITLRSTEKVDDAATPFSTTRLTAR
jgi:hypothetical protein